MWRNAHREKRRVQSGSSTKSMSIRSIPGMPKANIQYVLGVAGVKLPGLGKGMGFLKIIRRLSR